MKVVVIGAGSAGLAAAASLSKMGANVTLYEKSKNIGGILDPVKSHGYEWSRVYSMQRFLPGQFFQRWMKEMECEIPAVRIAERYLFPELAIQRPDNAKPGWLRQKLEESFPSEKRALRAFFKFCDRMCSIASAQEKIEYNNSTALKRSVIWNYLFVSRYVDLSANQLLDRFFKNEKLKTVLLSVLIEKSVLSDEFAGIGLPLAWSETKFDAEQTLERTEGLSEIGNCQIVGGTGNLVSALMGTIKEHGGRIITGKAVRRVEIDGQAVRSVILDDGTKDEAEQGEAFAVILTGDPRNGLIQMIGREHLPKDLLETMETQSVCSSAFAVHLGVSKDVDLPETVTHVCCSSADEVCREIRSGVFDPTKHGYILYSSSAYGMKAPEGKQTLSILAFAPRHADGINWMKDKERLAKEMINLAEQHISGLSSNIDEIMIETPDEYAEYGNDAGSIKGLVPVAGMETLPHTVQGIRGLYLAGQYTGGGGGVGTVMRGAWQTARCIESDYFLDATQNQDDEDDLDDL